MRADLLPRFPFGSDFDADELRLIPALTWLKSRVGSPRHWPALLAALIAPGDTPDATAGLERLRLQAHARPARTDIRAPGARRTRAQPLSLRVSSTR